MNLGAKGCIWERGRDLTVEMANNVKYNKKAKQEVRKFAGSGS